MTREEKKRAMRRELIRSALMMALCVVLAVGVSCFVDWLQPVPVGVLP